MKTSITKFITTTLLASAGLALLAPSAKAYTYSDGDLFLGFYSAAKSQDYLLYIGNYSNYTTSGGAFTGSAFTLNTTAGISIGTAAQINADLTAVFGAGWFTDSSVKFGAVGTLDYFGANTMFLTDPNATSTTPAWSVLDSSTQQGAAGDVISLATTFGSGGSGGATALHGKIQGTTSTGSYFDTSPLGSISNGASFEYYGNGGIDTGFRTNELTELVATDASMNGSAVQPDGSKTVVGQFSVGGDGTITYAAVPEPSTYAMAGIGAMVLAMVARRKTQKA